MQLADNSAVTTLIFMILLPHARASFDFKEDAGDLGTPVLDQF